MTTTATKPVSQWAIVEQEKKRIMLNIKELQRDLIKASFKQHNGSGEYAEILEKLNQEREKIKLINKRFVNK
ncbi:MAG: hypothetical protein KDI92_08230 [Xanthomonadales bacterium]|nr:hypothetical protein [Xanthomonadales bacterium]